MTACTECGKRIWKVQDGGAFTDAYIGDQHVNCSACLEVTAASREAIKRGVMAPTVRPVFSKGKKWD